MPREPIRDDQTAVLPDVEALATRSALLQRRLETVWESARRTYGNEASVDQIATGFLTEMKSPSYDDARHLAARAGMAMEALQAVLDALDEAQLQGDINRRALAVNQTNVDILAPATNVPEAQIFVAQRQKNSTLVLADLDLRHAAGLIWPMVPALTASVSRRIHGCVVASRRHYHADTCERMARARLIVDQVRVLRAQRETEEAMLLTFLDKMRKATGEPLPIPELIWADPALDIVDPFAGPTLLEP
jgi:hypothetical protein